MSSIPLIAHVIFRLDYGGLENGLVNLLNALPKNFRHAVVCLDRYTSFAQRIRDPDVELYALSKKPGKDPGCYVRLWRLLRELRPAVVHTRNLGTIDCAWIGRLAGAAVRIHGLHGWDIDDLHGDSARYRRLYRLCDPAITRYVAVSRHIADWLVERIGVERSRVEHICNGVDTERFAPEGPAVRPPNARPEGLVVFGSVGRLAAVKHHIALIRAAGEVIVGDPAAASRFRVALVGDGPMREYLEREVERLGLAGVIWFAGSRDDVPDLLRGFDVFVLPSVNEGISNTILEAMATGRPVVATQVGGNPELLVDGATGALVPPDDPAALARVIRAYLETPGRIAAHGAAARAHVLENFSMERMTSAYASLYARATGLDQGDLG